MVAPAQPFRRKCVCYRALRNKKLDQVSAVVFRVVRRIGPQTIENDRRPESNMIINPERLPLTQSVRKRKVEENRDQLTPFSAPSGPARLSETHSSLPNKLRVFALQSLPLLVVNQSVTVQFSAQRTPQVATKKEIEKL